MQETVVLKLRCTSTNTKEKEKKNVGCIALRMNYYSKQNVILLPEEQLYWYELKHNLDN